MDKKNGSFLARFRGWFQAGAALLTNIHLPNFAKGVLYQGKGKTVCVPGLNCYSCPGAAGACPIGSFQAVVGSSKFRFSYYITGILILLGVLLGRFICGFLCPFGWLQELLHKIPGKKFSTKKLKPLTYIKYVVLLFAVVLLRGQAYAPMRKAFLHTRESVGEMLSITRTSMPISLQMAMETGTFTFGGVMMGWLGTVELASYQVILTISTLGFMFYYSIGAAVAIRVSNYVGRGNQAEVRRSTWAGYHILLAMVVAVSFLLYFAKEPLVGIFTDDSIVAASAMALILPLIIYQCGDATQICFANALRGTGQ